MRVSAMLFVAPVFGGSTVPTQTKMLFSLMLALILLPMAPAAAHTAPIEIIGLAWLGINELLVGLVMGFSMVFIFAAIQYAGQIIDFQMGFAIVNLIDPTQDVQIPVMGFFHFLIAILIFLAMDAHHWIIRALVDSFEIAPITTPVFSGMLIGSVSKAFGGLFVVAARIAAPTVTVLMLYNASLGIIAKTVPQINLLIVGFPIRIALGMMVVGLSMAYFHPYLSDAFDLMVENVYSIMYRF